MIGKLILEDGTVLKGKSFGAQVSRAGEVVFSTGMVGYPESFTDPSYAGQILVLTYPLIGNYGVPDKLLWESEKIHITALIFSTYNDTPSHFASTQSLADWLREQQIPALEIKDTRLLTQKIREKGTMLGKVVIDQEIPFYDPNKENLVAQVSTTEILDEQLVKRPKKTVVLIDCGAKRNIRRCLLKRGIRVITVPWDYNPLQNSSLPPFDALIVSNGPGDPKLVQKTIATIQQAIEEKIPTLGICMGNQLLALAAGGDTYKLKFGHRSHNQPCVMVGSPRCYITTQNHGFAVSENLPKNFKPWFVNANDNSIEGIKHTTLPIMSAQFHPEATSGPEDTEWIFDYFLEKIMK